MRIALVFFGIVTITCATEHAQECKNMSKMFSNPRHMIMNTLGVSGCFDINFSHEAMEEMDTCFEKLVNLFMMSLWTGEVPDSSEFRKTMGDFYDCMYGHITEGDTITRNSMQRALDHDVAGGKDTEKYAEIILDCTGSLPTSSLIEQAAKYEYCIGSKMIDYCDSMNKSLGMLPLFTILATTVVENNQCDTVELPPNVEITYKNCSKMKSKIEITLPKLSDMNEAIRDAMVDLPAVQAHLCTLRELGFFDENYLPEFEFTIDYVKNMNGFKPEVKDIIIGHMETCVAKAYEEEDAYKRDGAFMKCFAPRLTSTCGIDNKLAKFFMPMLDQNYIGEILSNIKVKMENGSHIKAVVKFAKEFVMGMS